MPNTILTRSGHQAMQRNLAQLQDRQRELSQRLGAIDEDSTESEGVFFDTRTELENVQAKINDLRTILANAVMAHEATNGSTNTVTVGQRVTVIDDEGDEIEFDLIAREEIVYGTRGVSEESPVGKALIGCKVGETAETQTPDGTVAYKIKRLRAIPDDA